MLLGDFVNSRQNVEERMSIIQSIDEKEQNPGPGWVLSETKIESGGKITRTYIRETKRKILND